MSFREDYERLIELLVTEKNSVDIVKAKEDYWKLTGRLHGEESFFELRMYAFFDWYIFDRKVEGKTIFEAALPLMDQDKEIYRCFAENRHDIFQVKSITATGIRIRSLFTGEDTLIDTEDGSAAFYISAVFEGRVFKWRERFYLSPALCFHPRDSWQVIKHVMRSAKKAGHSTEPIIHRLAYMNLKWETYRNIKVKDIYKFEEYGKPGFWWKWF